MLLANVQTQCQTHIPPHTNLLVGLSGGVDSVVLLHLLCRLNLNLRAVYVHHGLSPNADRWADFCEQLCKRWDIPFILQKVQVDKTQGVEAGARAARYRAIGQIIAPNEMLAVAHHLDDQAETFLLALKRGSGVKGLSAMQAVSFWQNFAIFRPLLSVNKAEILAYAKQHQLEWVNDESNQSNAFDRNFLRNEILPLLNQRWEHFSQRVARSSKHCADQQDLLEELLAESLQKYADFSQYRLKIADFPAFSRQKQQQLIRLWLEKCGQPMPTTAQLEQILNQMIGAEKGKNPELKLNNKMLRRYQNTLYLTDIFEDTPAFSAQLLPQHSLNLPNHLGEIIHAGNAILCKKLGKIDRLPLPVELAERAVCVKLQAQGKIALYGKSHREEMKKIWQQNGVPVWERPRTPLVFIDEMLIGVIFA